MIVLLEVQSLVSPGTWKHYSFSVSHFNLQHAEKFLMRPKVKAIILECVVFSFLNLIAILYIRLFASMIRCLKVLFFAHSEA